ncbi:AMP-dependent synthetase, partial [Mycolicibacterium elephantis]
DVRAHFRQAGVAIQKWPEELHRVPEGEDFPRTASGKVQKFLVRERVQRAGTVALARRTPGS